MKNLLLLFLCVFSSTLVAQKTGSDLNWRAMGANEDYTFYEIQEDFNNYWKNRTPEKGQGYSVFKRWETYMMPRVYPTGDLTLPSNTYGNYMAWLKDSANSASERSVASDFMSLGPSAVPSGYDSGAGRVDFVRFDPINLDTIFVGSPDGGLWKSTDGGANWATNTDMLGVIGCSDLVIDPTNTQNMYLATGNWENDKSSIGVLKSTDGGTNWSPTSLVFTLPGSWEIRRMLMHPSNPLIMMVATDGGIFRTTDGWVTNTPETFGGTFPTLYDMEFKPGDPNVVYAAGKGFWRSDDIGATWTQITSGLPASASVSRTMLAVTADDAAYVYAVMGDTIGGFLGLYRSTDSGVNFSTQSTTPNLLQSSKMGTGTGGQATHDLAIAVAPGDKDKVTVGGINQWRSTDGGVIWNIFTYWLGFDPNNSGGDLTPPYTHADIQDIQYLPGSSTTMFTTADGGIYKTTDDGATWTHLTNNLSIAQQTSVAMSATTEGLMVTGLQDIGTIKRDAGGAWSVINGGDGESAFIDRTNDLVIVTSNPNGAHDLSTDGGTTKNPFTGIPAGTLFFSPVSQDPVTATTMYAGGRSAFYKNIDFVNNPGTWVTLGTPPEATTGGAIIRYAVAPSNTSIIYVIKGNGGDAATLSKSTDGGSNFTNITGTLPTSIHMTNLTVSNTNPDKVWVTYAGFEAANKVFRSTDGGTNWENMSGGLPNISMNTIVHVNDSANDELYLGADIGIYYYDNTFGIVPGNWTAFNTNLPNTRVNDLKIFYPTKKLRAATYGRGTWESAIPIVLPVELSSFSGENRGNSNLLSWTTDSETDLDYYSVERSKNGEDYESIGRVEPESQNSTVKVDYKFTDSKPSKGINYYRLKIVDNDSKFEYSKVIVLFVEDDNSDISLFPNPTSGNIEIKGIPINNVVNIRLLDSSGRLLRSEQFSHDARIDVSGFPNGTYFLEIHRSGKKPLVKHFIKE